MKTEPPDHDWIPNATWFECSRCGVPASAPHADARPEPPCVPRNQCMGCQAQWPIDGRSKKGWFRHVVVVGYPGEGVACTSDLYGHPRCPECTHFVSEHKEDDEGWSTCYEGAEGGRIPCNCGNNIGR